MLLRERLAASKSPREIFSLVSEAIESILGANVGALKLVVEDLPSDIVGFIAKESNAIVVNKALIDTVEWDTTSNHDSKSILFVLLTQGCLRNLGYEDEAVIMNKAKLVAEAALGPDHVATRVAMGLFPILSSIELPVDEDESPEEIFPISDTTEKPTYLA